MQLPPEHTDSTNQVLALYHFVDPHMLESRLLELQSELQLRCVDAGVLGTLLLAPEGINGTVTAPAVALQQLADWLVAQVEFSELQYKFSPARVGTEAFSRMKVKIKPEIVSFGPVVSPARATGEHVSASRWNQLLADPDVVVIDTRNAYEVEVGTFPGALDPGTSNFREFPDYVTQQLDPAIQPKIAMFCTGGIRCEKASAYLLDQGFESVYQLDGGILKYLETVDNEPNLWEGECFVFDQRVALDAQLQPGDYLQCHACRRPIPKSDAEHPDYVVGVSCPKCIDERDNSRRARFAERQRQIELAKLRGERHIGPLSQGKGAQGKEPN